MKVQLLGTGGADGIPSVFGTSRVSEYAISHGGKDVRTRTAALVDDDLKIDFGPDTLAQIAHFGLQADDWSGIVFTHSHDDHLCESELQYALYPFTMLEFAPFTIYGNDVVLERIAARYPAWPFELVETRSFVPFSHNGYTITPVHANHKLDEDAHNLIIDDGSVKLLYGTDTGIWLEPTWQALVGHVFGGVVIECSEGFNRTDYYGHLDAHGCLEVMDRLRGMGCLAQDCKIVTTHHWHLGDATHAELESFFAPYGIEPGYDGMTFEIG
ncbi:MAG: hypothetical protein JNM04_07735 [Chthonomonas sp.]|nr:hypothetical protein [Chthonomonas sp.]